MPIPILLAAAAVAGLAYGHAKRKRPRKVFFSFHYADISRVQIVKNSWVTKGGYEAAGFFDQSLEEAAKSHDDDEIEALIDDALEGTDVTVVLIGEHTSEREWVQYEIAQSAIRGNGLIGVHIDGLRDLRGEYGDLGDNPFEELEYDDEGSVFADFVPCYDWVIDDGYNNFHKWIADAPTIHDAP